MMVDLDGAPPVVQEIHRVEHHPVRTRDGSLRWDWDRLVREVQIGLERGVDAAGNDLIASIAIDTWGVDYGSLDERGRLIAAPFSYRDGRTSAWRDVVDR